MNNWRLRVADCTSLSVILLYLKLIEVVCHEWKIFENCIDKILSCYQTLDYTRLYYYLFESFFLLWKCTVLEGKSQILYSTSFLSSEHPESDRKIVGRCIATLRGGFTVKQTFVFKPNCFYQVIFMSSSQFLCQQNRDKNQAMAPRVDVTLKWDNYIIILVPSI